MDYKQLTDTSAIADNILKAEASKAEQDAYQNECELKRLKLVKETSDEAVSDEQIESFTEECATLRNKADRKVRRAGLKLDEVHGVRREFLEQWQLSIEQNHYGLTTLKGLREDELEEEFDDLDADERKALEDEIEEIGKGLDLIEQIHGLIEAEFSKVR